MVPPPGMTSAAGHRPGTVGAGAALPTGTSTDGVEVGDFVMAATWVGAVVAPHLVARSVCLAVTWLPNVLGSVPLDRTERPPLRSLYCRSVQLLLRAARMLHARVHLCFPSLSSVDTVPLFISTLSIFLSRPISSPVRSHSAARSFMPREGPHGIRQSGASLSSSLLCPQLLFPCSSLHLCLLMLSVSVVFFSSRCRMQFMRMLPVLCPDIDNYHPPSISTQSASLTALVCRLSSRWEAVEVVAVAVAVAVAAKEGVGGGVGAWEAEADGISPVVVHEEGGTIAHQGMRMEFAQVVAQTIVIVIFVGDLLLITHRRRRGWQARALHRSRLEHCHALMPHPRPWTDAIRHKICAWI